jgi:serine/threonine protein kinase
VGPQSFTVLGMIGKGSFGEVYLVQRKGGGGEAQDQLYAMKVLHKSRIMSECIFKLFSKKQEHNLSRYALTERNVLSVTSHPFIVKLRFAF